MLFGTCQYPKNIDDAHKVLSNHTWDNSKKLRSDKEKQKRSDSNKDKDKAKDGHTEENFYAQKKKEH